MTKRSCRIEIYGLFHILIFPCEYMISTKLRNVLQSTVFWISFIVGGALLFAVIYHFTNTEIIRANFGETTLWLEYAVSIATVLSGGLFFGLSAYKIWYFAHISHSKKSGTFGAVGSFLSIVVAGCPACSITLASYLGLSGIFSSLPFLGYEVRILGVMIMF